MPEQPLPPWRRVLAGVLGIRRPPHRNTAADRTKER
jgi:hypothetical protein